MTSAWLAATLALAPATAEASLAAPPAGHVTVERARYLMGTLCTAVAVGRERVEPERALDRALEEIARLEAVMTSWRPDSELSRLNAAGGKRFSCSEDLYAVLDSARALARVTDGAYDPTIEPLTRAWDLRGEGRFPSPEALREALAVVGWRGLSLDPPARAATQSAPGAGLDLGGIGKGFALDRAGDLLRRAGLAGALINLGGEILAIGEPPGMSGPRAAWTIEVAHPLDRLRPVVRLEIGEAAVSTTAQSERGFGAGARRYGHVLDPRTGRPVETSASVTVVAPSASRADALSTGLLVLGREAAAQMSLRHPELGILWLEPQGDAVRAWAWNLGAASAAPGAAVGWMNRPVATGIARTRP